MTVEVKRITVSVVELHPKTAVEIETDLLDPRVRTVLQKGDTVTLHAADHFVEINHRRWRKEPFQAAHCNSGGCIETMEASTIEWLALKIAVSIGRELKEYEEDPA